jgi:hypothetical protein
MNWHHLQVEGYMPYLPAENRAGVKANSFNVVLTPIFHCSDPDISLFCPRYFTDISDPDISL